MLSLIKLKKRISHVYTYTQTTELFKYQEANNLKFLEP